MNRKDISNINNIFRLVLERTETDGEVDVSEDSAYDKEGQNLRKTVIRERIFEDVKAKTKSGFEYTTKAFKGYGGVVATFFTKKGSPNDLLHNGKGPAIIIGEGGEGKEFYYVDGKEVDPESVEYRAIAAGAGLKEKGVEQLDDEDDFFS